MYDNNKKNVTLLDYLNKLILYENFMYFLKNFKFQMFSSCEQ